MCVAKREAKQAWKVTELAYQDVELENPSTSSKEHWEAIKTTSKMKMKTIIPVLILAEQLPTLPQFRFEKYSRLSRIL